MLNQQLVVYRSLRGAFTLMAGWHCLESGIECVLLRSLKGLLGPPAMLLPLCYPTGCGKAMWFWIGGLAAVSTVMF